MGLAAGQARLLTITGRKSDCEFQSMRLSHQKIALARELADISNEYQNSLNQTKLIYDYYGTGDTSMQLSYGILMNPSALNDYMPTTITDALGRVVLNSKYAAAARAAGIPQEGLGTLPSENLRNAFVKALAGEDIITDKLSETIQGLPYNQAAGFGGGATVAVNTSTGNVDDLKKYISQNTEAFYCSGTKQKYSYKRENAYGNTKTQDINIVTGECKNYDGENVQQMSLDALLSDDDENQFYLATKSIRGSQTAVYGIALMQSFLTEPDGFIDWLYDQFSAVLDIGDGYTGKALEYAYSQTTNLVRKDDTASYWNGKTGYEYWYCNTSTKDTVPTDTQHKNEEVKNYLDPIVNEWAKSSDNKDEGYEPGCVKDSRYCIGFSAVCANKQAFDTDKNDYVTAGINLNNLAKAFLTYFADYMNGVSKTDSMGHEIFSVEKGGLKAKGRWGVTEMHLATDNYTFQYTWKTGTEVSSDDLGQATFYDALFNQICANGWIKNDQVDDNEYLQHMLQNGMMYISKMKDDGYYYQGNYATDIYIKEITDESKIAYAESKYNTEKAKLNAKEQTIDLKMKNLDTEITSLTTEYDTVKSTISKNIETGFKRYG